jgi:hypothetical protein
MVTCGAHLVYSRILLNVPSLCTVLYGHVLQFCVHIYLLFEKSVVFTEYCRC